MTVGHHLTRSAVIVTAIAATVPALALSPAQAANPVRAATVAPAANSASSAAGSLIGTLAYRGAEHPYLVGNLADAAQRFGATSPQARAAAAAVVSNVTAIAHQLSRGSATRARSLQVRLLARDRAEVAYAAAVAAAHRAGVTGTTRGQTRALAGIAAASRALAAAVHASVPEVATAAVAKALTAQNARDEAALKAAALARTTRFAAVEVGSLTFANLLAALGEKETGRAAGSSPAVQYRAALEAVFTEHVYQTGLFGEAVLVDGPTSAAAVAAHQADGVNTVAVASLLRDIGTGVGTRSVWNRHITGYSDYLTHLKTGGSSVAEANRLFASYEAAITTGVHRAVPTLASAKLRATFTMHVTGTLTVFRLEKAASPAVYPMALMCAAMFAGFAATIAEHQTTLRVMTPMVTNTLG